jgi:lipooligosaccharide transport system ATP-binding protein
MDRGRIVAEGSPRALIEQHATREVVELRFENDEAQRAALPYLERVGERVEPLADRVLVYAHDGDAIVRRVTADDVKTVATLVRRGSLEDVFLILTGRTLEE